MITISLEQAVKELREINAIKPFEVTRMLPPGDEYYRFITFDGSVYKVCLTEIFMTTVKLWMLSVMKPDAPPNEYGAHLPTPEQAAAIAKVFFPEGFFALGEDYQILKMTCRKFISQEGEVASE